MLVIQNTKATTRPIVDTTSNKAVLEPWGTLSFAGDWRPIHLDAFWQRLQLQVRHSVGCGLDLPPYLRSASASSPTAYRPK
jgi:hypothetical protein